MAVQAIEFGAGFPPPLSQCADVAIVVGPNSNRHSGPKKARISDAEGNSLRRPLAAAAQQQAPRHLPCDRSTSHPDGKKGA